MKTAHLSWEEVKERTGGTEILVHFDGIHKQGKPEAEHMEKQFSGCELMQMTKADFMVTAWPERRKR